MSTRLERLVSYIWQHQHTPFKYGVHDCGIFSTRWVDKENGTDYMSKLATIMTKDVFPATLRKIKNPGGYTDLITKLTGQRPSLDRDWKAGALAVYTEQNVEILGIAASKLVYAPGIHGLVGSDAQRIVCYWSLECLQQ